MPETVLPPRVAERRAWCPPSQPRFRGPGHEAAAQLLGHGLSVGRAQLQLQGEHQDVWGACDGEGRSTISWPGDASPEANQTGR